MITLPKKWSAELAEESGWHIGDGSMNFYNGRGLYQLRGHIQDDREHYIKRIKPLFKKTYDLDISLRNMPSTGVFGFQLWNNDLVNFKHKKLLMPIGKKLDYAIPKKFKENFQLKTSFLRGLFDTDGCIYIEKKRGKPYPRADIKISCEKVSKDVLEMCLSLGIRTTRYVWKRKEKNWRTIYEITIRGTTMVNKWMEIVQPANSKHVNKWRDFIKNTA
jgi:hypothetical protein